MTRHFLVDDDFTPAEQAAVLRHAEQLKSGAPSTALAGRAVALVFELPSTRTRVSFEVAVARLGGHPVVLDARSTQLGRGETIEDTARVLSRYVDAIVLRTVDHDRLAALAAASEVPVVNALTGRWHPCQVLADLQTIAERRTSPATIAYLGDGANNMAASLLVGGAMAGHAVRVGAPEGYLPDPAVVERARRYGEVLVTTDPHEAAAGADVLCTDVWVSMGQADAEQRRADLGPYALDAAALDRAAGDATVLHCLPAHRGEEIAAEVLDGPASAVFDQAENRLFTSMALLAFLVQP